MDENEISQTINELLEINKTQNYEKIKRDMFSTLEQEKIERTGFENRLYDRWKHGLDLFETILIFGRTAGSEFNQKIRPYAAKQKDFVFDVLTRTHARSCVTMSAILSLLKSGHAGDALARARTLHEMRVIASFIQEEGNELAEKYLLYEVVDSLKAAKQYEKHYIKLGLKPLESGTIDNLEKAVQKYRTDHFPSHSKDILKGDYGWAAIALGKSRPTFADIEEKVGLDHWRPYFKMASYPIHPSAKGIKFGIGEIGKSNILPAGPSNAGLADPASITLISFNAITALLLTYIQHIQEKDLLEIHLKSLVAAQIMNELLHEAKQAFLKAHQQLVDDELKLQAQEDAKEKSSLRIS
ncbi:DUF5677 domain-containing protein [Dictyobacter aurantiacus]|uniref:Uncharacterized protein n=1 Tax=Dictyobacter aurantiacus TaxID=1936993 RepID=A0A401ZFW3_9CHLR|nr:DUF5677 domain-containing protein [Dictyobacter aurantiacus]GCE05771.1 hypothetical protein KDAU_31000 [Dictyobacter aurantiacus]